MDELKIRAGEKLEALHVAAKTAAGNGKTRVQDVVQHTSEVFTKVHEILQEIWHNDLFVESRERVVAWCWDAAKRIREGAPPLSPFLLYEELVALFKDRVWRRSVICFGAGAALGGVAGLALGLRAARRPPAGPHCRALHSLPDGSVILLEDAVAPGPGAGEVLVRVQAFGVCSVDRATLRGRGAALRSLLLRTHVTVGRGFAGVVLDVGPGVTELELGDEVWGCVSEWQGGAATELMAVRSTRVGKRPRGLAADAAAALPWAGCVALAALHQLKLTPETCKGKRIAVAGAASGEGCYLVQLLHSYGAHLTVSGPRHAKRTLHDLGAIDFMDTEVANSCDGQSPAAWSWHSMERWATRCGPFDAVLACAGTGAPPDAPPAGALLKATASRGSVLDVRPRAFVSDRLPAPISLCFAAGLAFYRVLRWSCGGGFHTDWLESPQRLTEGLNRLAALVDEGHLSPMLDKVYLPQDFETALAHACSDDAIGTTVIRFP